MTGTFQPQSQSLRPQYLGQEGRGPAQRRQKVQHPEVRPGGWSMNKKAGMGPMESSWGEGYFGGGDSPPHWSLEEKPIERNLKGAPDSSPLENMH